MKIVVILAPISAIFLQLGTNWGGYLLGVITGTQDKTTANILVILLMLSVLVYKFIKYLEQRNNERNAAALQRLYTPYDPFKMSAGDPLLSQLYQKYPNLKGDQEKQDKGLGS